jgi:hypothetical protein
MFRRLKKMLLFVPFFLLFAVIAVAETTPMLTFNTPGVYTHDSITGLIDTVDGSMAFVAIPEINPAQTLMVYNNDSVIKVYDLALKTTTSINTVTALGEEGGGNVAHFTADGRILFVDSADYALKRMDTNGTNIVTVASPTAGYRFTYFALSPDRSKLAIIENATGCVDYYACNTERLVMMNVDGTNPTVIKSTYVGEWNLISWKQDSQALLYYHHHFSGSVRGPAQYTLFDLSGGSVTTTDFSGGNWNSEENACVFTKKGNLLSMFYRELYDGRTGALIANVSSTVPSMMTAGRMMGWRINGEYYFADDVAGTNFRRFIEPGSALYADFTSAGLYQYSGSTWTQLTGAHPQSMVTTGSNLYASFTGLGLYQWNNSTWTRITDFAPTTMIASATTLYATFPGYGLYQYSGATWTQLTSAEPESMINSASSLYAYFAGYGLYQLSGTTWTKITDFAPTLMVTSGSILYAHFAGYGIFAWNGFTWTLITNFDPTTMVTSGSTLFAHFTGYGTYQWNGSTWTKITDFTPTTMITLDANLYTYFTGYGFYKYDGVTWSFLTDANPQNMVVSGSGLYGDFGDSGTYEWNGTGWVSITGENPASMVGY